MSKPAAVTAILLIKKPEIRDVIRQLLKAQGLKAENIINTLDEKECLKKIDQTEFSVLILDWEIGADKVQAVLNQSRKESRLEGHPVFLIAAHEDDHIVAAAREFFITYVAVGQLTVDTMREQIKGLVKDFVTVSPIRKMLLAVEGHRRNGEEPAALELLEKLFQKHPDNARLALELAELHIHNGDWEKAEALLKKFVNSPEPLARVRHLYSRCCLKRGDHAGAQLALKGAQLISPYNIERLLEMGDLFLKTDQAAEAEEVFNKALEIAPLSKNAKLGKSTSKLLQSEINEALQILQGIANPRELSAVFNTAAILAIRSQHFNTGMGLYKKAAELLAKNAKLSARIYYNMGIGFVKSGQLDKGLKCFQKSLEKDPEFKDAEHNMRVLAAGSGAKAGSASKNDVDKDFLAEFDEKLSPHLPINDFGLDAAGEEVELDELFTEIDKVG